MIKNLKLLFAKHEKNDKIQVLYDTNVFYTASLIYMEVKTEKRTITVAHSPDSDDAFMFYGLATNKLETDGLKFEHTSKRYSNPERRCEKRRL